MNQFGDPNNSSSIPVFGNMIITNRIIFLKFICLIT